MFEHWSEFVICEFQEIIVVLFRYINGVESFLSYNMGSEFACFAIIICTEMFTVSLMDNVTQFMVVFGFLFFYTVYAFMWNVHAEMVRSQVGIGCALGLWD